MAEALTDLGDVVLSLGKSDFDEALHGFCKTIIPCAYEHCFIFPKKGKPRVSFLASERSHFETINAVSGSFLDGGYSRDPALSSYGRRKALLVSRLNLSDHESVPEEFGQVLKVRHVLTVLSRIDRDICYLGFGLDEAAYRRNREFIDHTVRRYASVLLRLVHRHDQLMTARRLLKIAQLGWQNGPESGMTREEFIAFLSEIFETRTILSPKEAEICAYMAFGYSVDATSMIFGVSPHTIGTHRKRAFAKLGISNQADIFAVLHSIMNGAEQAGLVKLNS